MNPEDTQNSTTALFGDVSLLEQASAQEETTQPQEEELHEEPLTPETRASMLMNELANFPGAPSELKLEEWRNKYSVVSASVLDDDEVFIWRTLSREEHKNLQPLAARIAEQNETSVELVFEELVVEACMLWLSSAAQVALKKKGGTASTLSNQIMFHSNFLNPQVAASLVIKL